MSTEHLIRQLMTHVECAICGHSFQLSGVHVLGHENQVWLLSTVCAHCRSHGIVIAVLEMEQSTPVHELSRAEQMHFHDAPPVSVGDVLEMHSYLADFDGDLETLFDN